ncbi:MAG: type II secretion system protein M [Steroidobacteraceae bacterium]
MFATLRTRLDSLGSRERRMVLGGGILAGVLLVFLLVMPLERNLSKLSASVTRKQADLAWMQSVAPALASAGPAASVPATQDSLVVVIDRAARESGLAQSLTGSQPSGDGGLRVQLEKAPFNSLVQWLGRLSERNGVRVESASIDAASEPGLVNASIVLRIR